MLLPTLNDNVKKLYRNSSSLMLNYENVVIHSKLKDFVKRVDDSGLSIKTSLNGSEEYWIDGEMHTVRPNTYLVVNRHQSFDCYLKSPKEIEGFCFYISPTLLSEVIETHQFELKDLLAKEGCTGREQIVFREQIHHMKENVLGLYLERLMPILKNMLEENRWIWDFNSLYFNLAEKLVESHIEMNQRITRLSSVKNSTREELYRRLSLAFAFICDNYHKDIQLDQLARIAAISKYHLLRSFKLVYGITPYQKILQLRLERAKELLSKDYNLEEIAYEVGFSDRRSFTKAFKKAYQAPPSAFRL